jgi:hypothetical protein
MVPTIAYEWWTEKDTKESGHSRNWEKSRKTVSKGLPNTKQELALSFVIYGVRTHIYNKYYLRLMTKRIYTYATYIIYIVYISYAQPVCRRGHLGVPRNFHLSL